MKIGLFILGFILVGAVTAIVIGVGLWLLTLIITTTVFNWTFVLVVSAFFGVIGGYSFVSD